MSVKEDKVNLIITINGDKARKELSSLDVEARKLKEEMKDLNKESADYVAKSARLKEVEARMKEIRSEIGLNSKTLKELNQELRTLSAARQHIQPGTDAFRQNEAQIKAVRSRINELNAGIKDTGGVMNAIKNEIRQFGILAASYLGFQFLSDQITGIISKAGKLSDQLADVAKTTGMTQEEVKALNKELSKIDTRTSTTELRNIAVVAGQLGIAKDDVAAFVSAIDKANVALGDEFTGGAADVAQQLGKLRNIFTDVKSTKVDDDLLKIGNALNALGSAGAATGPVVADFSNRIGGVGINLGLTTGQVLGLSATLQELNVNTERGGTAVVKILQKMTTNTEEFAKVAKMDLKKFTNMVNTDLFGAFQAVVQGVSEGGASATAFGKILDDLGVDGAGASEVISKLAGNMPMLADKVNLAGQSLKNSDGIMAEFKIKMQTLGAQLDLLSKKFFGMATSETVTTFLSKAVGALSDFLGWLAKAPDWIERNTQALRLLAAGVIAYNYSMIAARASVMASTTVEMARVAVYQLGYRWLVLKETATKAYGVATDLLTGKVTVATVAQRAWNAVLAVNPVTAIIGSMFALVEVVDIYRKNTSEALALEKQKVAVQREIDQTQKELTAATEAYNKQIQNLNQLSPQQRAELQKVIDLKIKDAEATLMQIRAQQQQIKEASTQVGTWEAVFNSMKNFGNPLQATMDNAVNALENGQKAAEKFNDPIKELEKSLGNLRESSQKLTDINQAYSTAMNINAQTTEQYNEKLRLLRVALANAVVGSTEYKKIAAEIAKVQADMASKTGGSFIDNDAVQESIDKLKELQDEIKKLEFNVLQESRGKFERDVAAINQKYDELLEKAKGHKDEEARIQKLRNTELNNLELEFNAQSDELRNQLYFSRLSKEEQEIEAIRQKYEQKILDYQGYNDKIKELEAIRDAEIAQKQKEQDAKKLQDRMALEDQIWLLQLNANDREIAEEAQKWDKLIEQADAAGIDSTNLVKLKGDAINALVKKQGEQEQAERKRQGKEAVDFEKRKYDAMRDVTQSYLSSIGSLLYIFGAKQSEMINWQKTAAATQIVIDTATAISSITAKSTQGDPYTYAARVAIGVATVLANIAKAKQLLSSAEAPPPPQLYEGGRLPGGTVMPGTAASSDNLIVVDPQSGRPVATVASGEAVLSIETYKNNRPLVDALLDSSMNKGGASIIPAHFIGGLIDRPLTVAMQPNLPAISRSIAIDKFGSSSQAGQTSSETLSNSANIESLLILHESRVGQMMELFLMRLKDLEVVGRWDWERYKETTTRMNKLEKDSKIF